jgi:hypothetical protein
VIDLYREVEDPFGNQIKSLKFTQNPQEPSKVLKELVFAQAISGD